MNPSVYFQFLVKFMKISISFKFKLLKNDLFTKNRFDVRGTF